MSKEYGLADFKHIGIEIRCDLMKEHVNFKNKDCVLTDFNTSKLRLETEIRCDYIHDNFKCKD